MAAPSRLGPAGRRALERYTRPGGAAEPTARSPPAERADESAAAGGSARRHRQAAAGGANRARGCRSAQAASARRKMIWRLDGRQVEVADVVHDGLVRRDIVRQQRDGLQGHLHVSRGDRLVRDRGRHPAVETGLLLALCPAAEGVDELVGPKRRSSRPARGSRAPAGRLPSARGRSARARGPSPPWHAARRPHGSSGRAHPPPTSGRGAGGRIRWPGRDRYRRAPRTPWQTAPAGGDAADSRTGERTSDWVRPCVPLLPETVQDMNVMIRRCGGSKMRGSCP